MTLKPSDRKEVVKRPVRRGLGAGLGTRVGGALEAARQQAARDPYSVYPALRQELMPIALASLILTMLALLVCSAHGYLLLYGDAVAHLGIARRILDARYPGLSQLGGVWLPLPHLLMVPFVQKMEWWQNGLAGAWPSMASFILAVAGCYRLARRLMPERWAFVATAFFALNANLLYLSTTAMTEPLFLALLLWVVDVTLEAVESIATAKRGVASRRMIAAGVLIFAMVFTRYDGWIIGAAVWLVIAVALLKSDAVVRRTLMPSFAIFTAITVAGPLLWFWYNAKFEGDWLDFLRGPYSAAAIDKKTSPPGSQHYRGWHSPVSSLLIYMRTAQVVASAWETGFAVTAAAVAGVWLLWKQRMHRAALLLWVPLPFYVYSVSWGSVPIFIPQMYPHSYYNSRYGIEMLPAFAICVMFALAWAEKQLKDTRPTIASMMTSIALALVALNLVAMIHWNIPAALASRFGIQNEQRDTPLVLQEALVNSSTRIPFERSVAQQLELFAKGKPILIDTSDHIGVLQQAGIPLKSTLSPGDRDSFAAALASPAKSAAVVVAFEGDPVAKAVAEHPEGLQLWTVLRSTGQPVARFYKSEGYGH